MKIESATVYFPNGTTQILIVGHDGINEIRCDAGNGSLIVKNRTDTLLFSNVPYKIRQR